MKKYKQTKEEKAKLAASSTLFLYMTAVLDNDPMHVFTKDELQKVLSVDERTVRHELERIANYYPVVAVSSEKGYRLMPKFSEESSVEFLENMLDLMQHQINEIDSRVESLKARKKPLIAYQNVINKILSKKAE